MDDNDISTSRILITDDAELNIMLLSNFLRAGGFTNLVTTRNPRRSIELVTSEPLDIVLLDLHMPEIDGFEVLAEINKLSAGGYLPVIVMTGDVRPEARERALSLGAADFLTKPLDATEVLLRVKNLLRTRGLYVELEKERASLEERVHERTSALEDARRDLEESLEHLTQTDKERHRLVRALIGAQEEERARIASDIHDDSIQVMTAVGMRLGMLRRTVAEDGPADDVEELEVLVNLSIDRLRRLLFELRPLTLDREGLGATLRLSLEDMRSHHEIRYQLNDELRGQLPPETRVVAYRIAQEALSNVRKHARATEVEITLESHDGGLLMRIRDDGQGFALEHAHETRPGHLGLPAMRERAELVGGWFRIDSAPQAGTTVECWIPEIAK
jgi:signal transduction histidine kinase